MSAQLTQLEQVRAAIDAGNLTEGRRILRAMINEDPQNYRAWMWLSGIAESSAASLSYAQHAHSLAPDNSSVNEALVWAQSRVDEEAVAPPVAAIQPAAPVRVAKPITAATATAAAVAAQPATAPAKRTAPVRDVNYTPPPAAEPETPAALLWIRRIAIVLLIFIIIWLTYLFITDFRSGQMNEWFDKAFGVEVVQAEGEPTAVAIAVVDAIDSAERKPQTLLPAKTTVGTAAQALARWTPTPSPTPVPTPTPIPPTPTPVPVVPGSADFDEWRWIDVDLTNQTLVAYEDDIPVFTTYISSGTYEFPTVTGQFRIYYRLPEQDMNGYLLGYDYYVEDVPFVQYFFEDYALHGAYWHNNFGVPMSHGCVNLSPYDAQWLYNFSDVGTLVNVHY